MNILVTGAFGQLGSWMRILSVGSADSYVFADVAGPGEGQPEMLHRLGGPEVPTGCVTLDITDASAVRNAVVKHKTDVIVNCAAFTNVDAAEDREELAESLNATAVGYMAAAARDAGALLVHVSTDYVFGGDPYNTPCTEDRRGTPTGAYGRTKLHGEQAVLESGCDYVILRTAWLYSEFGKNFLKTMLGLTASRPEIKVVFDQAGTPTYAANLARAIMDVIADYGRSGGSGGGYDRNGIYNYSDEGVCSWFDFAHVVAEFSGHAWCRVLPCHSDEFPSKVIRPAYSVLDKTKIKETFGVRVPYWTDGVKMCLSALSDEAR